MSIQQCNRWYSLGLCGWFFLPLNQSSSRICKRHTYAVQSFSDHEWDSIVMLCVSSVRMCVYCKCRLEFRVQLEMDTVNHVGLLLIPPPTRPPHSLLPLHILAFRAQTSTQISIHSLRVSFSLQRDERRVRKDRKGQSVSDCRGSPPFVCCRFVSAPHNVCLEKKRGMCRSANEWVSTSEEREEKLRKWSPDECKKKKNNMKEFFWSQ